VPAAGTSFNAAVLCLGLDQRQDFCKVQ